MPKELQKLESYSLKVQQLTISVDISKKPREFVPSYDITIITIAPTTQVILNKIREEFLLSGVDEKALFELPENVGEAIREEFKTKMADLLRKYFPGIDQKAMDTLLSYLIIQNLGLGPIEILLSDPGLEEIVINSAKEPVWVYHKRHGWLKTNIILPSESRTRHLSTIIGREIGKDITILNPLMDASLRTGDRVNATLQPISSHGNTITIRKFATKPWTIVDFIKNKTIAVEAAAYIWLCAQYELSALIVGGTGTGKTSALNVLANFFPPNQRIVSIEDTREVVLPKTLHWVPLETRLPNPEGKGGVSMLDLVVNSLRMRPDRIIVGEIRRKAEAEVLFEAMHTGHSVFGTLHANNAEEAVQRLTNPPIDIPKAVLPALPIMIVQNRNRRTGARRTFQLAEIMPSGDAHVFLQLDIVKDQLRKVAEPTELYKRLNLFTGMEKKDIEADLNRKGDILRALVKLDLTDVNTLGYIFAKYYTEDDFDTSRIPAYIKEFQSAGGA
jgi:flagellar protein FlaI